MRWLGRGYQPARRTWYGFRDRVGEAIEAIHEQIIHNAIDQNLLDPEDGVQDGTSVAACASRHKMVNRQTLDRRMVLLEDLIEGRHPRSEPIPSWVPPTDSGRLDLANRMQIASDVLDERIAKNAARQSGKRKDPTKIRVSLTAPAAPLGRDKMKIFRPMIKRLEGHELLDAQREKMNRPDVQARYALQGQTVELGFADAKAHRSLTRFHGRGPKRAQTETGLLAIAQNLMRIDRLQRNDTNPNQTTTQKPHDLYKLMLNVPWWVTPCLRICDNGRSRCCARELRHPLEIKVPGVA